MEVEYQTPEGSKLNPAKLPSGTDLKMVVEVSNPNSYLLEEVALSTVFPSGWEILNTRLEGGKADSQYDEPEYQDFRDDRVYSYFDLNKKESKTFVFYLTAAYVGDYYFPGLICESMYNMDTYSYAKGFLVEVSSN